MDDIGMIAIEFYLLPNSIVLIIHTSFSESNS